MRATVLALRGPIGRADIPILCELARALLEGRDADVVLCDMAGLLEPDAVAVDALARLQLTVRRLGGRVEILHACGELRDLIALFGLVDVLPLGAALRLEPRGQPEEGEQALGVEEEADPGDPMA